MCVCVCVCVFKTKLDKAIALLETKNICGQIYIYASSQRPGGVMFLDWLSVCLSVCQSGFQKFFVIQENRKKNIGLIVTGGFLNVAS